jgi:hypothetical protein
MATADSFLAVKIIGVCCPTVLGSPGVRTGTAIQCRLRLHDIYSLVVQTRTRVYRELHSPATSPHKVEYAV